MDKDSLIQDLKIKNNFDFLQFNENTKKTLIFPAIDFIIEKKKTVHEIDDENSIIIILLLVDRIKNIKFKNPEETITPTTLSLTAIIIWNSTIKRPNEEGYIKQENLDEMFEDSINIVRYIRQEIGITEKKYEDISDLSTKLKRSIPFREQCKVDYKEVPQNLYKLVRNIVTNDIIKRETANSAIEATVFLYFNDETAFSRNQIYYQVEDNLDILRAQTPRASFSSNLGKHIEYTEGAKREPFLFTVENTDDREHKIILKSNIRNKIMELIEKNKEFHYEFDDEGIKLEELRIILKNELGKHITQIRLREFVTKFTSSSIYQIWDYKTAQVKYHKILKKHDFQKGGLITTEDFDKMFKLLRDNYSANQALNISIINEYGNEIFNTKLRDLYYSKDPFPYKLNEFLKLSGISEHTLSEFLVIFNLVEYPLSTNDMKLSLDLDKGLLDLAKKIALRVFNIKDESYYKDDAIDYLIYIVIYKEMKNILDLEDLYQINLILWAFGKENQLKTAIKDYKQNYLQQEKGKDHLSRFDSEKKEVNQIYKDIISKKEAGIDISDLTIDYLLPIRRKSVLPAGFNSLTAMGVEKENFPEIADSILILIEKLLQNFGNSALQKDAINMFISSGFQKGIQQGILSPTLYCLNPYYLVINSKVRKTVRFISEGTFNKKITLSKKLENYITDNERLKEFLNNLYEIEPEFKDFDIFDAFCHWMSETSLGGYVKNKKLYRGVSKKPIIKETSPIEEKLIIDLKKDTISFKGLYFEDEKILKKRITNAILNGKHIILIGPPGTGKSKLAELICEEYCGENNYLMTTATSDWSTFETIGGYRINKDNELEFNHGLFLQTLNTANDLKKRIWLIIDELNRADIDKAFGSLFSALTKGNVVIPYEKDNKRIRIVGNEEKITDIQDFYNYYIPADWRIIATMNTYDKSSLYEMSYAFMRRFAFVPVEVPRNINDDTMSKFLEKWGLEIKDKKIRDDIVKLWATLNNHRKIGPAIVEDICRYIITDKKEDFFSILIMYIFPQFEGLIEEELRNLFNDLFKLEFFEHQDRASLKSYAMDFFGIKLDES